MLPNCMMASGTLLALVVGSAASQPVQWRVEDGGNGHWYQYVTFLSARCWYSALNDAEAIGGYLGTITTLSEHQFVNGVPNPPPNQHGGNAWLGAFQDKQSVEPGEFKWVTGETWSYTDWAPSNPSNDGGFEDFLSFDPPRFGSWNDLGECYRGGRLAALFEWSADCNNDGIVDFGQILDGTLIDADANGIPDICEQCPPDFDDNGLLNFFDIAAFVVFFQTQDPRADFNADGLFNFFDFSEYLAAFNGGCP